MPRIVALLALQVAFAHASFAGPTACPPSVRPQDTIWLVSSRGLGFDLEQNAERLGYWRYDRQESWVGSSLDELTAGDDPRVVTVVFVHGNRIPACEAFTKGWRAYRKLVACADERPVRFVIWSWPSDRVCGPVQDARIKAARTNRDSYYLAWFLNRLDGKVPVSLWGHSFGARIVTGALHLTGGGEVCGHRLERSDAERRRMQAVLVAAALDNDWLLDGRTHGLAISQVDAMLLVNNSCDRLLARYRLLYHRRSCREALGYTGLAVQCLSPDDAGKIAQIDACCDLGRRHCFNDYLDSASLMAAMRDYLLFDGEAPANQPRAETTPAAYEPLADLLML